jgi:hypothetical protein
MVAALSTCKKPKLLNHRVFLKLFGCRTLIPQRDIGYKKYKV